MEIKLGRIKVEPQDIASGDPEEPFECAIAHALHRYGYVDPIVNFETIEIHENETEYLCSDTTIRPHRGQSRRANHVGI